MDAGFAAEEEEASEGSRWPVRRAGGLGGALGRVKGGRSVDEGAEMRLGEGYLGLEGGMGGCCCCWPMEDVARVCLGIGFGIFGAVSTLDRVLELARGFLVT